MQPDLMALLACPVCRGALSADRAHRRRGELRGGHLACRPCRIDYPILLGRPLLVPPDARQTWSMALDEAVGWEGAPRNLEKGLAWLASVGVEAALAAIERQGRGAAFVTGSSGSRRAVEVTDRLRRRANYRLSGAWFRATTVAPPISDGVHPRAHALKVPSVPIPRKAADRTSLEELVHQVRRLKPLRLLDVGCGGGFCVSRTLAQYPGLERTVAVDRSQDDCIWVAQHKLIHLGVEERAEVVGGDVRALPLRDGRFDVATCFHVLFELYRVSDMLCEVHRVLQPGGHLVMAGSRAYPLFGRHLPEGLSREAFAHFLDEADLHHGDMACFHARAARAGFEVVTELKPGRAPDDFVAVLRTT